MTAARFIELIAFVLIPLALVELWWSDLLFANPWEGTKPFDATPFYDGPLSILLSGVPAMVISVLGGMGLAAILGLASLGARERFLALVQILALGLSVAVIWWHPVVGFAALWIMAGFFLIATNLIAAFLIRGLKGVYINP